MKALTTREQMLLLDVRLEAITKENARLQAQVEGLESSKNQEKPPFNCGHCKHLLRSDRTNKMFCTYHSDGEMQYVTYPDDYCSYFERSIAELEAAE